MGIIARYLDVLPGTARARVIVAQNWTAHRMLDDHGCRCLVGHAEDWGVRIEGGAPMLGPGDWSLAQQRRELERRYRRSFRSGERMAEVDLRFDRLVARVGIERAVQLAKRRAARVPARKGAPVHAWVPMPVS